VRTADTHNTTAAIQSYNTWIAQQRNFDLEVQGTIGQIGNDIKTYNTEIARDQPNVALLRENLAKDHQLLEQLGSGIDNLTAATSRFEQITATLQYDKASATSTIETLDMISQYMKIYTLDMGNAHQHLIEYVNNAEAYIRTDDPNYWNDKYRQDAMLAKDQGSKAFAESNLALENITIKAQQLEKLQ
jgi:hypothetical protein